MAPISLRGPGSVHPGGRRDRLETGLCTTKYVQRPCHPVCLEGAFQSDELLQVQDVPSTYGSGVAAAQAYLRPKVWEGRDCGFPTPKPILEQLSSYLVR